MTFSVISEEDAMAKFKKAESKISAIRIIADLTASSEQEVADFLGVKLIKKRPWVLEK